MTHDDGLAGIAAETKVVNPIPAAGIPFGRRIAHDNGVSRWTGAEAGASVRRRRPRGSALICNRVADLRKPCRSPAERADPGPAHPRASGCEALSNLPHKGCVLRDVSGARDGLFWARHRLIGDFLCAPWIGPA